MFSVTSIHAADKQYHVYQWQGKLSRFHYMFVNKSTFKQSRTTIYIVLWENLFFVGGGGSFRIDSIMDRMQQLEHLYML